jgi:anaerobic selenocysteine-containing dehydrogenase
MPDTKNTAGPEELKNGVCAMCDARCPTRIHVRDGRAVKIDMVSPVPCPRSQAQLEFIYHPDRLQYPLKRIGSQGNVSFKRIAWDEALDAIAANLQKVKEAYGAEAVVFWIAFPKEPRPFFHRLAHAFGSPNYCTESSSCFSSAWLAANLTYGPDVMMGMPSNDPDIKCRIVWGTSIQNSSPRMWPATLESRKNKELKLIVVDPRRTKLAEMADIHLQPRPGTDGALALGMMNVIIGANLHDKAFLEKWTVGFEDLKKLAEEYPPKRVEKITGVSAAKIKEAAITYATTKPAEIQSSSDSTTHHTNGLQNHRAIILLPAITGNIKVPAANGAKPPFKDITLHERVADMPPGVGSQRFPLWTKRLREMQSNALADQIDSRRPYPIKALLSAGLDIQFFANSNRMVESLKKLDFIAVTDYFLTPGAQLADIVLPIASWVERPILSTGPDRASLLEPAIAPVGESRPEWQIYTELARRLGLGGEFWDGSFEKCVDDILEPSGLTYARLRQHPEGMKPARPAKAAPGKAGFKTPSGKIEIACETLAGHGMSPLPVYQEPPEGPLSRPDLAKTYPLVLTTGARVPPYVNSQYRNIPRLRKLMPDPLAEINPADAAPRGIKSGDNIVITSPRGRVRMKAEVTDTILPGVVSLPHHWAGEANANLLIDDQGLDPVSGFPPFKSQLCQVSKV